MSRAALRKAGLLLAIKRKKETALLGGSRWCPGMAEPQGGAGRG